MASDMPVRDGKDSYYRPSVSTDIIVFLIREDPNTSWRHDSLKRLSVLLVRRGLAPYDGCPALPGGFLHEGETLEECAAREIREETGVMPRVLMPCGIYDAPDRDPRERVITRAYASIMNGEDIPARGGDDAREAAWYDLKCENRPDGTLRLMLENETCTLCCLVKKQETHFGEIRYSIEDSGGLAFDHAAILAGALGTLRGRIRNFENVFEFLPPLFTLSSLQNTIETICDITYTPANFRRKAAPFVEETDEFTCGSGHRPARLYRAKARTCQGGNDI